MDGAVPARNSPVSFTRRVVATFGLAAVLWGSRAHADDEARRASALIRDAGVQLSLIARAGGTRDTRRAALKPFLDRVVDFDNLARFCLGRYWNLADPARRARYQMLFETVILLNVLNRLDTYQDGGSRVVVGNANQVDDAFDVPTTVKSENDAAVKIAWRVSFASGAPKIVDVTAEGISLRVTLRGDFISYLRQNGNDFDALLNAMQRMTAGS